MDKKIISKRVGDIIITTEGILFGGAVWKVVSSGQGKVTLECLKTGGKYHEGDREPIPDATLVEVDRQQARKKNTFFLVT